MHHISAYTTASGVVTQLTETKAELSDLAMRALVRGHCITDTRGRFQSHSLFIPVHEVED